jgi:hypothetical protein
MVPPPTRAYLWVPAILSLGLPMQLGSQNPTYSDAPLRRFIPLPHDTLRVAYRGFPEWLEEHRTEIDPGKVAGVREELYLIIQSFVKYVFDDTGSPTLERSPSMAKLFDLGTELRVIGAGLVARNLDPDHSDEFQPTVLPDSGLSLEFANSMFTIRSADGWSARFPYYFALWTASRVNAENGISGQIVAISTLHGQRADTRGREEATITVLSSNTTPLESFERYWLDALDIPESDTVAGGGEVLPNARHYHTADLSTGLLKDVMVVAMPAGPLMIAYTAHPGVYEDNREHFLDFLRTVQY